MYCKSTLVYLKIIMSRTSKNRVKKGFIVRVNLYNLFKLFLTRIKALKNTKPEEFSKI